MRKIVGLREARLATNPWGKNPKAKGAKALGLRFERKIGKLIPQALHNQWIRFEDNNGLGFCCPDFLLEFGGTLFILECKLTDWNEAEEQTLGLYKPVLGLLWPGDISCITVAKNLSPFTRKSDVVGTWEEAFRSSRPVLHAFKLPPPKVEIKAPHLKTHCNILQSMEV